MKNIVAKVSGDLIGSRVLHLELRKIATGNRLLICVGGGTQINEALVRIGVEPGKHGPLGRELRTSAHRIMAREVLFKNASRLMKLLGKLQVKAEYVIPVVEPAVPGGKKVICHINGDIFITMLYLGFDKLYVFTKKDRERKKREQFRGFPKIEVIGI